MEISVKSRYALASMIIIAKQYESGEYIPANTISKKLGISKIYLEQVFTQLKKDGLVKAAKGAQGGYRLTRPAQQITVYEMLSGLEISLFKKTDETVAQKSPEIENTMQTKIFNALVENIEAFLKNITLNDLVNEADKYAEQQIMYYI